MIAVKPGVRLTHQTPAMAWATFRLHEIFLAHGIDTLVITSGDDGDHGQRGVPDDVDPTTLHGKGNAHDYRIHGIPVATLEAIVAEAKRVLNKLGPAYDVVVEALGTDNAHLHVEWQPHGGI